jgi:hypothetical protein
MVEVNLSQAEETTVDLSEEGLVSCEAERPRVESGGVILVTPGEEHPMRTSGGAPIGFCLPYCGRVLEI